jgi:cysteine-rich repeat protein
MLGPLIGPEVASTVCRMRTWMSSILVCGSLCWAAGCDCGGEMPGDMDAGGDAGPQTDAGVAARCGDNVIAGAEECDDGNRDSGDGCSETCQDECGDGMLANGEICDPGITAGEEGACPTECDDGDPCTTDALDGTGCSTQCSFAPISAAVDDDDCCAPPNDATNDSDCSFICGNGVLEEGEICDTTIASGLAGACPSSCDDGMACTADTVQMPSTCQATCESTPITADADGDGCCLSGSTLAEDSDCPVMCGDGVLSSSETCDTGIAAGQPGACPTTCDDGRACTTDMVANDGTCDAFCTTVPVPVMDGDGCCPPGSTAPDSDCTGTCDDGVVDGGETCDTAIATGAGSCPTSCSADGIACTSDSLAAAGTCRAACIYSLISTPANGDGCCPSGATRLTDDDCPTVCGDGAVSGTETCDTAIATGTGSCPSACDDADMCTVDALFDDGTCSARCTASPVPAGPSDGCCPPGATLRNDPNCPVACGDGVVSSGEECDDGNTVSRDGCSSTCTPEAVAFRFNTMALRDPHIFADVFGCIDVTNFELASLQGVNPALNSTITSDRGGDGYLDLSVAQVFDPLAQVAGTSTQSYLVFPDCTAPLSSTSCTLPSGAPQTAATAMNMGAGAVCLGILPGTATMTYTPAISVPTAPAGGTCYVANAGTVMLDLRGIPITLEDAQIAGEWFGNPATEIRDGLLRGFVSEADADATIIPAGTTGIASIDGQPLSLLLRGGRNNCSQPSPMQGDKDTYTPAGGGAPVTGWYFYLNFSAVRVPYSEL